MPKLFLRGGLIHQLEAVIEALAARARGVLPPGSGIAIPGARVLQPHIGAFVAGPDDPIWQGRVGDVGAFDRSDPRMSPLGGLPQAVRSSGAPWRPRVDPAHAEYLVLYAGFGQSLLVDGGDAQDLDPADVSVEWSSADGPGLPALRLVRQGNPQVYEIVPYDLREVRGLAVKDEIWRFRCRVGAAGLTADLPDAGFVTLTVPGVPGRPYTDDDRVRGIGVAVEVDLSTANLPVLLRTYTRPREGGIPAAAEVASGDVRAVPPRTVSLSSDFALLAEPPPEEGLEGWEGQEVEPPLGMEFEAREDGLYLTAPPLRTLAYDRVFAFARRVAVDQRTDGARDGVQWDMDSFVHLRLINPQANVVPMAPRNLAAQAEYQSFRVTWDPANDVTIDEWQVQYRVVGDQDWTDEDVGRTNLATVSVLVDGATGNGRNASLVDGDYEIQVRAVNNIGPGPWAQTTGTLPATGQLPVPRIEGLTVEFDPDTDSATLRWSQVMWAGVPMRVNVGSVFTPRYEIVPQGDLHLRMRRSEENIDTPAGIWRSRGFLANSLTEVLRTTTHRVSNLAPNTYYGWDLQLGGGGRAGPRSEEAGGFYRRTEGELTIDSPEVEGPGVGATAELVFTVRLAEEPTREVTVDYRDRGDGTATAGVDYERIEEGTLTFAPGETEKTITVVVRGGPNEPDETVIVQLLNPMGGARFREGAETIRGIGTILGGSGFQIDNPTVPEPTDGTATMTWTVRQRNPLDTEVSVRALDTGEGTATEGADYNRFVGAILTFAPGETRQTLSATIRSDEEDDEGDETIIVDLDMPSEGVEILQGRGTGTITDEEGDKNPENYRWSISDAGAVAEGETLRYQVRLNYVGDGIPLETGAEVEDTGDGTATSGTDYEAVSGQSFTATGSDSWTVEVPVRTDTEGEPDETVILRVAPLEVDGLQGVTDQAEATGTILGDPEVSIEGGQAAEPSEGQTATLSFTVRLAHPVPDGSTGRVEYADAGTGTATSGEDYEAISAGTLEFSGSTTEQSIDVTVRGDDQAEEDETVAIRLSNPEGLVLPGGGATLDGEGTILARPVLRLRIEGPASPVKEPEPGSPDRVPLGFRVVLETEPEGEMLEEPVTVTLQDSGRGSATAGSDYDAFRARVLTFSGSRREESAEVMVRADRETDEPEEDVELELVGPSDGATIEQATARGRILDYCSDFPPLAFLGNVPGVTFNVKRGFGIHRQALHPLFYRTVCDWRNIEYTVVATGGDSRIEGSGDATYRLLGPPDTTLPPTLTFGVRLAPGSDYPERDTTYVNLVRVTARNIKTGETTPSYTIQFETIVRGSG